MERMTVLKLKELYLTPDQESGDDKENESEGCTGRGERKDLEEGTEQCCTSIF